MSKKLNIKERLAASTFKLVHLKNIRGRRFRIGNEWVVDLAEEPVPINKTPEDNFFDGEEE